jgi:hypothetical protein
VFKETTMDSNRFDDLTRTLGTRRDRRGAVKFFGAAALGAVGVIGLRGSGGAAPGNKVSICHLTDDGTYNYISVSSNAIPAHAAHGDVIAPDFATDVANCGGCVIVCSAPEHATAFCGEAGCGFTCDPGYEPDGNGGCELTVIGCASAVLSGPGGSIFCVDDGIHVYVNGALELQHTGTAICYHVPVEIVPVVNGDSIQVVANNSPITCGDVSITPFYLTCQDTGVEQTLDAVGYGTTVDPGCGVVFYDRSFTVAL